MSGLIDFESSWEKAARREEKRKTREIILEKAKSKYEKQQRKEEEAKRRGEGTWMLPSVDERIESYQQVTESTKSDKKKKKKKDKKKKKKKSKDSSSGDSESDSEPKWIEKAQESKSSQVIKGPHLQRDSWMMAPMDLDTLPGVSRAELRAKKQEEEEERKRQQEFIDRPGQHDREMNPYWKQGGTGLPEQDTALKKKPAYVLGDCGVGWLKKALLRCHEQAKEENTTVEEVAAVKYGSLKKLKSMLDEAEAKLAQQKSELKSRKMAEIRGKAQNTNEDNYKSTRHESSVDIRDRDRHTHKPHRDDRDTHKPHRGRRNSDSNSSDSDSCNKYSRRDRRSHRDYDDRHRRRRDSREGRSPSRERRRDYKRRHSNEERSSRHRFQRPRSDSDSDNKPTVSKRTAVTESKPQTSSWRKKAFVKQESSGGGKHDNKFMKPGEESKTMGGNFLRPGEEADTKRGKFLRPGEEADTKRGKFLKPGEENISRRSDSDATWRKNKDGSESTQKEKRVKRETSSDSSSSSSESSSELSDNEAQSVKSPVEEPVVLMSEEEMNKLGAKIVKAEILGNDSLAAELKSKLERARKARLEAPKEVLSQKAAEGEENVVVLTRTDKRGLIRPVDQGEHPQEPRQGKRKKKQQVATHSGSTGDRDRYFHDDDKYDLKTLVEREKMGTAEDANMMFARLAGKSAQKTDEEWQIDDVFMSKATSKQSDSQADARDRMFAIMEHKKMAKSMEACQFCFDKIPKHLIIAIGTKCYLCLPNHKSLSEGHCLIVPMQHATQGTAVDEDVWAEIQVFRRSLTEMFSEREEDCVFMEMSRNLKHHPHMYIDCVPMPQEVGDMAPIYFKKAIMESESEWAQNKKVVDLSKKDVRRAVPKGFPYFSVDFGLQGGFAHVIEDEKEFPAYFGREVIGGMLDVGPELWRKPKKEHFEEQRKKVLQFADWWKPHDCTQKKSSKSEESQSKSILDVLQS